MWVHLSEEFIRGYDQPNENKYIYPVDVTQIGDKKPSIRTDLIDREENFDFNFSPSLTAEEKIAHPNSPVNNPALYSNVMLDTGEFVYNEVDISIPGRGFDFIFARNYRSQAIYSGPLGWGWDYNYNKRLVGEREGEGDRRKNQKILILLIPTGNDGIC